MPAICEFAVNGTVLYPTSPEVSFTATGSDNVNLGGGLVQQSRLGMVAG